MMSQYAELPTEEDYGSSQTIKPARSIRRAVFVVWTISFLTLILFVIGVSIMKPWTRTGSNSILEDIEFYRAHLSRATGDEYLLGVGKADITGPVVEVGFMGYADLSQTGTGLRQRIYSRAFIVGDISTTSDRFIYLVLDTQAGDTAIRNGILEGVAALGSEYSVYGTSNIAVTGTHSHSGPGAWHNYLLPQITTLGFDKQSYQAIVDGAVLSVQRAHESLTTGYLSYGTTDIEDANLSRSPYAYLANPAAERAQYTSDVDKTLTMLRFQRASDGKNLGVLTWFPVHGTSMLENSTKVTGDNKGVAAYLFEKSMASDSSAASGFVAGFSQANVGDTTPNVLGAYCDDGSGTMCDFKTSTCNGTSEACHGRGPAFQKLDLGVSSCYEIGRRQFAGAKSLYDSFSSATPVVGGSVKSFHTFTDMTTFNFILPNGTAAKTCPAALGYSFAAGTSDGPGAFDFTQADSGTPNANPLWAVVKAVISQPTPEQAACQYPKPILLNTGELTIPYNWSPNIVDHQLLRAGQFIMVISPSEATTMAGRRWKAAVKAAATSASLSTSEIEVVLGGPANSYTHYLTTEEEYGIQRYEGASTLYGPNQLNAYINITTSNIKYLSAGSITSPPPGPSPPDNRGHSLDFISPVVYDNAPIFKSFGQQTTAPLASYSLGSVVNATFVAANPRNNLRLEGTFAAVEQLSGTSTWTQVQSDDDWNLVYYWYRDNSVLGTSHVVVSWETDKWSTAGTFRLRYYGDSKSLGGAIKAFSGTSSTFKLS